MVDLITLTASDLRGCDGGMMCKTIGVDAEFHGVTPHGISVWLIRDARQYVSDGRIECHPSDYISAWLGPVGVLCNGRDSVRVVSGQNQVMFYASDKLWGDYARLDCPPALASAMGSSVWRKTENGWEVVS